MTSGARNMPGKGHARQEKMPRSPRKQLNPGDDKEFCVVTWGRGDQNQLGNGEQFDRAAPVTMLFTKTQISSMACGHMHTLIMVGPAHSPRVFAWGEGQHGQLGLPKSASMQAMHPVEVQALAPTPAFKVLEVGAGGDGSFALTSRQEMLVWGNNSREQLGLGSSFRRADKIFTPQPLSSTWDTTEMQWRTLYIKKAVLGRRFGLAIDKYDRLFAWGENNYGQLGVGDKNSRNSPVMVEALQNVRQIAVGLQHSAAIDSRRLLWTWGDCSDGRLGHGVLYTEVRSVKGDEITRNRKQVDFLLEPKCVDSFRLGSKAREVQLVACGDRFTAALDCHGTAWTWGSGIYGQLGRGSGKLSSQLPERVSLTEAQSMSPDSSMMQQEVSRRMSLGSFDGILNLLIIMCMYWPFFT
jgi:alpha-tubulin suppressor-like RCC1 family protein